MDSHWPLYEATVEEARGFQTGSMDLKTRIPRRGTGWSAEVTQTVFSLCCLGQS